MSFRSRPYSSKIPSVHPATTVLASGFESQQIIPSAPNPPQYSSSVYSNLMWQANRVMVNNESSQKTLVCYLPKSELNTTEIVSCVVEKGGPTLVYTTDSSAATIPEGAIIDSIEFFGYDNFTTKDVFSIGLGQLNEDISFPLIQKTTAAIANERVGGCRDFISYSNDGNNLKNIVICNSHVNVELGEPVTHGGLQIVIRYHMKML